MEGVVGVNVEGGYSLYLVLDVVANELGILKVVGAYTVVKT